MVDDPDEQADLEMLGAVMTAEAQAAQVKLAEGFYKWAPGYFKVEAAKARSKSKRR